MIKISKSLNRDNNKMNNGEDEEKKIQNQLQNELNHNNNNKCFSQVSAVSILTSAMNHSLPLPP